MPQAFSTCPLWIYNLFFLGRLSSYLISTDQQLQSFPCISIHYHFVPSPPPKQRSVSSSTGEGKKKKKRENGRFQRGIIAKSRDFLRRFPRRRAAGDLVLPLSLRDRLLLPHVEAFRPLYPKRFEALALSLRSPMGLEDPNRLLVSQRQDPFPPPLQSPRSLRESNWLLATNRPAWKTQLRNGRYEPTVFALLRMGSLLHNGLRNTAPGPLRNLQETVFVGGALGPRRDRELPSPTRYDSEQLSEE